MCFEASFKVCKALKANVVFVEFVLSSLIASPSIRLFLPPVGGTR